MKTKMLCAAFLCSFLLFGCNETGKKDTGITLLPKENFEATVDGKQVSLYTLENKNGMVTQITNYGGRVVNLWVPTSNGKFEDIVLGFDSYEGYKNANEAFFGTLIGRYGNRIAKGKFTLNGTEYTLPSLNNNGNQLHGGEGGFHNRVWDARQYKNDAGEDALELTYLSKDGEEGYPGNLNVKVIYTLTNNNELKVEYDAETDAPTVLNLTHHSFFNFKGAGNGDVLSTELMINADNFTPTDSLLIPTGEIASVEGTPMDFRQTHTIGERIDSDYTPLIYGKGYDHNWILNKTGNELSTAAVVYEPSTGIEMTVKTTEPAMQFYAGNFLDGKDSGKGNKPYNFRTAMCYETQHYPDSPNHENFPSTVLNPGEKYTHTCIYAFNVRK